MNQTFFLPSVYSVSHFISNVKAQKKASKSVASVYIISNVDDFETQVNLHHGNSFNRFIMLSSDPIFWTIWVCSLPLYFASFFLLLYPRSFVGMAGGYKSRPRAGKRRRDYSWRGGGGGLYEGSSSQTDRQIRPTLWSLPPLKDSFEIALASVLTVLARLSLEGRQAAAALEGKTVRTKEWIDRRQNCCYIHVVSLARKLVCSP